MAAFPLGMVISETKEPLMRLLRKRNTPRIMTAAVSLLFLVWHFFIGNDEYGVHSILFCGLVVFASSWIRLDNPVLQWAGNNAFTVFIIQRLPMIVLASIGVNECPAIFISLAYPLTFLLAEGLARLYKIIDVRLFANG